MVVMVISCSFLMIMREQGGVGVRNSGELGGVRNPMLRITRSEGLGRDHQDHDQANAELTQECEQGVPQSTPVCLAAPLDQPEN